MSDDLRRQRHDLHEPFLPQLAAHRPEDARRPRLPLVGDEHGGVLVEADVGAILALGLLGRPHDDRPRHLALLDLAGGDGRLDRDHDDVPEAAVAALGPAEHADHEGGARPRVVRDPDDRFLLDHARLPYRARSTISTTRHRLVFDKGRVSAMRTVSPALAPSSSCAATCLVRSTRFPYRGCAKRRTIATVTVCCLLSFTTATQPSGFPFPLPIRVSAGFFVIGLSGNSRIHTLPPRFISRVSATRAASICRFVIHPGSSVISP